MSILTRANSDDITDEGIESDSIADNESLWPVSNETPLVAMSVTRSVNGSVDEKIQVNLGDTGLPNQYKNCQLNQNQEQNQEQNHQSNYSVFNSVSSANIEKKDPEKLVQAFEEFTDISTQLIESYDFLQARVDQLTKELASVSQQRVAELKEKEKLADRLRSLLHMLPAGVLLLDENGIVVDSNSSATELLLDNFNSRLSQDDNHHTTDDLTSLNGVLWRHLIQKCFKPRRDDGHEISLVDGRRVNLKTTAMVNERGQLILLTDMTETRQLQAQLSQYERLSAMGKMVASLAHQIRTPLSAATLYADHLCNPNLTDIHRLRFSGKLKERLHHLESQIRDMLIFAKGDAPLNDIVTINEIVKGIDAAAEVTIQQYSAEFLQLNSCSNILIRCNHDALISSVMNLINNSLEALESTPNRKVTVEYRLLNSKIENREELANRATDEGDVNKTGSTQLNIESIPPSYGDTGSLAIIVSDNGPGINSIQQSAILEPFFTTKTNGTGLGLAVVKAVSKAHGGNFYIHNRQSQGASAVIELPASLITDNNPR